MCTREMLRHKACSISKYFGTTAWVKTTKTTTTAATTSATTTATTTTQRRHHGYHTTKYDVAIVGGGIIGLATAQQLLTVNPSLKCILLEKEDGLAMHQTGHNSGVVHAGMGLIKRIF